jgi:uncharacterized membrane protein YgaE (UPF0421/DUF939 family)
VSFNVIYRGTVVSSLAILVGGILLAISTSSPNMFSNPLYFISIGLIIAGIFIQVFMSYSQESRINNLKEEISKFDLNSINFQISNLQSQINRLYDNHNEHIHSLSTLNEFIDIKLELEFLKRDLKLKIKDE